MSSVKNFGAAGDGQSDDTEAIQHAVRQSDGEVRFPKGVYRITQTIQVPLDKLGPLSIHGTGGTAKVVMAGPGPAFRITGTHGGTGDPGSVHPDVRAGERLPIVSRLEIEGAHPQADGLELIQTLQAVIEGVLVGRVRHGIHLTMRNRNVLIHDCHIYHNTAAGIYLDGVNLHQINIIGNHISYNRTGGIRIERSEIRNLQITGNDIEYNNHRSHETEPEPTAEIYVDTTAERSSVDEITIASNTIQATESPGGANIRIVERPDRSRAPGLWTITGNVIGSQENNVHLTGCHGVVISGNFIYSCGRRNLLIEHSRQINVGGNNFRRHTGSYGTGVRLVATRDSLIHGCHLEDESQQGQASGASLLELVDCRRINVSGCQLLGGVPYGIDATSCSELNISGCTVIDPREKKPSQGAIRFTGRGTANLLTSTITDRPPQFDDGVQVQTQGNIVSG